MCSSMLYGTVQCPTTVRGLVQSLVLFACLLPGVDASVASPETLSGNGDCRTAIQSVLTAADKGVPWALEMVDACGRRQSGLMRQGIMMEIEYETVRRDMVRLVGNFDQCRDLAAPDDVGTDYITAKIQMQTQNHPVRVTSQNVYVGLCVPQVCAATDDWVSLQYYLNQTSSIQASIVNVHCHQRNRPLSFLARISISSLLILGLLVVMATVYDVVVIQDRFGYFSVSIVSTSTGTNISLQKGKDAKQKVNHITPGRLGELLLCFSLRLNVAKLVSTEQSEGTVSCVHGIRVINATWTALTHTHFFGDAVRENVMAFMINWMSKWHYPFISKAGYGVDTTFVLSGFLTSFVTLGKFKVIKPDIKFFREFYLHRFLRLTPAYALIILWYATLFPHVVDGPLVPPESSVTKICDSTWWKHILYVTNLYNPNEMCTLWSWTQTTEMHFHIISPVVLLAFYYMNWRGLWVPVTLTLASSLMIIYNCIRLSLPGIPTTLEDNYRIMGGYYYLTYTRIGPYLVGLALGFLSYKTRNGQLDIAKRHLLAGLVVVGSCYVALNGYGDPFLTMASGCTLWALCVGWLLIACTTRHGGIVNGILSSRLFVPLARLNYSFYLTHATVIKFYFFNQRRLVYMSALNLLADGIACIMLSLVAAVGLWLLVETPFCNMERTVRGWGRTTKHKHN